MLEPFVWMFKAKNFKQRYFQLLFSALLVLSIAFLTCYISSLLPIDFSIYFSFFIVFLPVLLIFFVQGYFWQLTSNVIAREVDISASNVYSGEKIKYLFKIELPDFKPLNFIWRGFAGCVASILMMLPFLLLVLSSMYTKVFFLPFSNIEIYHHIFALSYNIIYFVFFALIPAMLWLYAKENSVVAVWKFRRAIQLLESYPSSYFKNTFIFILFYLFNYFILFLLAKIMYISSVFTNPQLISLESCLIETGFIFIVYVVYLYSLHVYSYLLGTIVPTTEV